MNIQLYALSTAGEFLAVPFADVTTAGLLGDAMVDTGAWKTWDAFDVPDALDVPDACASARKLVASYHSDCTPRGEEAAGAAMALLNL
jgi:hypothetical protein